MCATGRIFVRRPLRVRVPRETSSGADVTGTPPAAQKGVFHVEHEARLRGRGNVQEPIVVETRLLRTPLRLGDLCEMVQTTRPATIPTAGRAFSRRSP
jgi:hypothetical protein